MFHKYAANLVDHPQAMKKSSRNFARAWAPEKTVLSIGAIFGSAILLVSSVEGTQAGGEKRLSEKRSQRLSSESVQEFWKFMPNGVSAVAQRQLSVADRVAYQYAIEEVYWRHRIWPGGKGNPKPPLDQVMSSSQVERKVENYLRNSQILSDQWQRPITSEQLQAEMERMASQTKQPDVLHELFVSLNNDPTLIAECLARPLLAERLVSNLFAGQKEQIESWMAGKKARQTLAESIASYTLPQVTGSPIGCIDDGWIATTTTNMPVRRNRHTGVWTGTEMIVWGGEGELDSGGRYSPSTDSWVATSTTGAPEGRMFHTAVWTGIEMIVWGGVYFDGMGFPSLNTGGRYNPSTDSWVATTTSGAPSPRSHHTAVWTGTEMIIWSSSNPGGRYNPSTNSWVAISTTGAPAGRARHTAIWTGTQMIVWGGSGEDGDQDTGGRYTPSTNSWVATRTTGAPAARDSHTAVWTGTEMIVWGGTFFDGTSNQSLNTGGKYNPSTDSWLATSTIGVPAVRTLHTAVWTGTEMIVWGGTFYDGTGDQWMNTGGRYTPSTNSWVATSTNGAPDKRAEHAAVWSGTEMIVWGGYVEENGVGINRGTGGRYCAQSGVPHPPILGNISTRLRVETDDNAMIGGFIVTGTQAKKVIVRAIGPSLPVSGALVDPILELRDSSGQLIRTNDNWRSDQEQEIMATGIPPSNESESAIVETLPANGSAYTAIVKGAQNGTGLGLVEVYDLDQTVDSKLANISTRGLVRAGDNAMIAGTIVLGQTEQSVLVRAIGPSLTLQGKLADPTLELRDANGTLLRANDNWRSDQEQEIMATGIPPSNDLESAVVATLPANGAAYTAIVRGVNDATGVALIEIYGLAN
jgi:N-acetylneuraminic acid mutarotase